jgi:hypothetical protein
MSSAPSSVRTMGLCNPLLSSGLVNTFPRSGMCYESGDVINNKAGAYRLVRLKFYLPNISLHEKPRLDAQP